MTEFDSTDFQEALRELNDEFPGMSYDPSLSRQHLDSKDGKITITHKQVKKIFVFSFVTIMMDSLFFLHKTHFNSTVFLILAIVLFLLNSTVFFLVASILKGRFDEQ